MRSLQYSGPEDGKSSGLWFKCLFGNFPRFRSVGKDDVSGTSDKTAEMKKENCGIWSVRIRICRQMIFRKGRKAKGRRKSAEIPEKEGLLKRMTRERRRIRGLLLRSEYWNKIKPDVSRAFDLWRYKGEGSSCWEKKKMLVKEGYFSLFLRQVSIASRASRSQRLLNSLSACPWTWIKLILCLWVSYNKALQRSWFLTSFLLAVRQLFFCHAAIQALLKASET